MYYSENFYYVILGKVRCFPMKRGLSDVLHHVLGGHSNTTKTGGGGWVVSQMSTLVNKSVNKSSTRGG